MPFYVYAWITNIFYGLGTVAAKLSGKHQIKNPWLLNFLWNLFTLLLTIIVALWYGVRWPTHWVPILLVGLFSAISGTFYILALNLLDISVMSPLYSFRSVFSVILGVLLFREFLAPWQYFFVGLIVLLGLFVSLDEHLSIRSFFHPSIALAVLAVCASTLYGVSIKYAMQFEGYWEVVLWGSILPVVFLLPTIPLFWRDIRKPSFGGYWGVILLTVFGFFGFLTSNKAYGQNVGITSAILSIPTSMILAFIFSLIAPQLLERHTLKIYAIRFSAAAVMILAALKLTS
jgi:drug/metabolite transporter (DMT)-like permease